MSVFVHIRYNRVQGGKNKIIAVPCVGIYHKYSGLIFFYQHELYLGCFVVVVVVLLVCLSFGGERAGGAGIKQVHVPAPISLYSGSEYIYMILKQNGEVKILLLCLRWCNGQQTQLRIRLDTVPVMLKSWRINIKYLSLSNCVKFNRSFLFFLEQENMSA